MSLRIVFSYLLIAHLANARRYPYFRNAKFHWNSNYFSNFTIQIQNNSLYASIDALKTFYKGFKAHVENTVFKKWFKSLLKAGNLMQNCPIYSGHYYLEGWKFQSDLIPSYLYAGNYRLKSYTFYGKYKGKDEVFLLAIDMDIDLLDHA